VKQNAWPQGVTQLFFAPISSKQTQHSREASASIAFWNSVIVLILLLHFVVGGCWN